MLKNIESLIKDDNGNAVQIGSSFVTTNGTLSSPLTLAAGIVEIEVPVDAVEFIVNPDTSSLDVSESSTMTTYDIIAGDSKEAIPCARMEKLYIRGSEGQKVNFRFTVI